MSDEWIILSTDETDDDGTPLGWSNAEGWVSPEDADAFSSEDVRTLILPLGGRWARP